MQETVYTEQSRKRIEMSNSALIKKVKDAEKKAADMRLKAMEDSRVQIRQAEEDTAKEKEQLLKDSRISSREALKKVQEQAQAESAIQREKEIKKNNELKEDVKSKLPEAVEFIIENARKGIG